MSGKIRNFKVVGTSIKHGLVEDIIIEGGVGGGSTGSAGSTGGPGGTGGTGATGATGATGSGSSGINALVSYPSTSRISAPLISGDTGEFDPIIWAGIGQTFFEGFWASSPTAVAFESDGARQTSFVEIRLFDDGVIAPFTQTLTWAAAIPYGFTTWASPLILYHKVASLGSHGDTTTLQLNIYHPTSGSIAATASRSLVGGGSSDSSYQALSISAGTLNAIGFQAQDLLKMQLIQLGPNTSDGQKIIHLGKFVIGWG